MGRAPPATSSAGWKANFMGGHVRTTVDGFYNEYDGFQAILGRPNNPRLTTELNVAVTLDASLSLTPARGAPARARAASRPVRSGHVVAKFYFYVRLRQEQRE